MLSAIGREHDQGAHELLLGQRGLGGGPVLLGRQAGSHLEKLRTLFMVDDANKSNMLREQVESYFK